VLERSATILSYISTRSSQSHMPTGIEARVALVGTRPLCRAAFRRGTSLALTGAHFLAEELQRSWPDHATAFGATSPPATYVKSAQRSVEHGGDLARPSHLRGDHRTQRAPAPRQQTDS